MRSRPLPVIAPESTAHAARIAADPRVQAALQSIRGRAADAMALQIELCEIPAPTFEEGVRAQFVCEKMREIGLEDVHVDAIGNATGLLRGTDPEGPLLAVGAHMDTVFPAGTDVTVRREGSRYFAPGIGDNCSGQRAMLEAARALVASGIRPRSSILFVGTVGEEGNGDIRGSKFLFSKDGPSPDGMLAVDNTDPGRILWGAIGAHRWRFTVEGKGGHSYSMFGKIPSAVHAIALGIARVAKIEAAPDSPFTYNVGTVQGGTSVNTIAAKCSCDVDMRSLDNEALLALEARVRKAFAEGVEEANAQIGPEESCRLVLREEQIGNRPAGERPDSCPVLQAALASQQALGIDLTSWTCSSTDANMPVSLGIPATCLSAGGRQMKSHTTDEYFDDIDSWKGPQLVLLTALALAGTEEVPGTLARRAR